MISSVIHILKFHYSVPGCAHISTSFSRDREEVWTCRFYSSIVMQSSPLLPLHTCSLCILTCADVQGGVSSSQGPHVSPEELALLLSLPGDELAKEKTDSAGLSYWERTSSQYPGRLSFLSQDDWHLWLHLSLWSTLYKLSWLPFHKHPCPWGLTPLRGSQADKTVQPPVGTEVEPLMCGKQSPFWAEHMWFFVLALLPNWSEIWEPRTLSWVF